MASIGWRVVSSKRLFVTATPARHGPVGIEPITGDVAGFALGVDQPGDLLYVTGDTLWYHGTAEVAQRFSPKVVMLHTGRPNRVDAFT
ncbi:MAG: hypothetical protein FWC58_00150 [Desulfobulbus sp.]|nr:hypothetical protein [Desulfobulbus sp.]